MNIRWAPWKVESRSWANKVNVVSPVYNKSSLREWLVFWTSKSEAASMEEGIPCEWGAAEEASKLSSSCLIFSIMRAEFDLISADLGGNCLFLQIISMWNKFRGGGGLHCKLQITN